MTIENFKLPKGRIVGGHPVRAEKKLNFQTKQPVIGADGQPVMQWRVEYAIPKDVFLSQVWPYMAQEAATAFPINPQTGQPNVGRDFSWKLVDGDSNECPKGSKVPYNTREGYPGHYVLTVKTEAFAPGCVVFMNGAYHNVEEYQVKVGDYICSTVDIRVHTNNDGGLYINPKIFELVELGAAIATSSGSDPNKLLGDASTRTDGGFKGQLPQAGQVVPQTYATPTQPMAQTYAAPAQPVTAPVTQIPQPAHDLVQNAMAGNFPAQAAPAGLPSAPPAAGGIAAPVTTSPGNTGIPGLPIAR